MSNQSNIAAAFVAAQAQLTHVVKDKVGQARGAKYKYAELADVVEMIRPLLREHGLAFQSINAPHPGGALVRTRLIHESGETMESEGTAVPAGDIIGKDGKTTPAGAQQYGSAYTYARRYDLIAFLGIAADDDDGAAAMEQHAARVEAANIPRIDTRQLEALIAVASAVSPTTSRERLIERYEAVPAADFESTLAAGLDHAVKQNIIGEVAALELKTEVMRGTAITDIAALLAPVAVAS